MSALPPVSPHSSRRPEPDAAYARAFFDGCVAALSTLLDRAVTIDLPSTLKPADEPLNATIPLPWVVCSARFTRGLAGAHELVFSEREAIGLARLVIGEAAGQDDVFTPECQDAMREIVNQMVSSASSSLRMFFGKPVGMAPADMQTVERIEGWTAHAVSIAVVRLTIDGVPRATVALTIPASVRDEAGTAPQPATLSKGAAPSTEALPGLDMILDIGLPVTVELGRTRMLIRDILALGPGSVIELDKLAGEPVDLLVNDRPIAKGEVVVIDENFGVRLTQISHATDRIRSLA